MVIGPEDTSAALYRCLADLHGRAFAGHGHGWTAAEIAGLIATPGALLIVDEERKPAGFGLFRQVEDEAELLTLAVEPSKWNNSIGRTLMNEGICILAARRCAALFLEVAARNDRALGLYRGLGFSIVGQRRAYYSPAEAGTACVMRLTLNLSNS